MFYTNLKYSPLLQKASQAWKHELLTTDVCKKWSKNMSMNILVKPSLYSSTYRCAQKRMSGSKDNSSKIQAKVLVHVLSLIPTGRLIPNHPDGNLKSLITVNHIYFAYILPHRKTLITASSSK